MMMNVLKIPTEIKCNADVEAAPGTSHMIHTRGIIINPTFFIFFASSHFFEKKNC